MMAISTQTEALVDLYTQKLELDRKQLEQINTVQAGYTIKTGIGSTDQIKIWGPTEVIQNYDVPIIKLDKEIVNLNVQIANLQDAVLSVGQSANSVGCGTTGIFPETPVGYSTVTVYQDQVNYKGYSYSGSNPYSEISGSLTIPNSGLGTMSYVTQVAIGSYFGPISAAGTCAGYATSITNLNDQISTLQLERNGLIEKVNFLKIGRSQYQLQNYAYEQSKTQINTSIGISSSILSFLKDPTNSEWL
jgi:hypothetical protein